MRRLWLTLSLALLQGCGTEPSGTLTLTVEDLPMFALEASITVRGTVTREPPSDTPVIVTVAGGTEVVSDTVESTFSFSVTLKSNQENQLSVMAYDGTGSVADAVVVSVFHDDTGPRIVSSTPINKQTNVALTTGIQVRYGEPLVESSPTATFTLKQNSRPVPGTATLSGDRTLFTFQPDQPLEPASIYEMVLTGYTDEAGNSAGNGDHACFITTFDGTQTQVTTDTSQTFFSGGTPSELQPMNILGATLARLGSTFYGVFEFEGERTLTDPATRASVWLDIDIDNTAATGFQSFKDFQFDQNFPELNTGLGAEFVVALDGHILSDSAFVGSNSGDAAWNVIDAFQPGVCGRYFGFHTTTIFGDPTLDDGFFAYAYTAFAIQDSVSAGSTGAYADPVPISGSFAADLSNPGAPFFRSGWSTTNPVWPPRKVVAPAIHMMQLLQGR